MDKDEGNTSTEILLENTTETTLSSNPELRKRLKANVRKVVNAQKLTGKCKILLREAGRPAGIDVETVDSIEMPQR